MSSTKRVSGNYDIFADNVNINGNLTIIGAQTSVESTNSSIKDNIIVLNQGETGAGITLGAAGIQVDRGSFPSVAFRYNEIIDQWEFTNNGSIYNSIAAVGGPATAGGIDTTVQYNVGGSLDGELNFSYDYNTGSLYIGNIKASGNTITTHVTNANLILDTNGTGKIVLQTIASLENQISDPTSSAGYNHLYAKTPSGGGTGLYFVNTTASDELVSKTKAIVLALVFS